MLTRYLSLIEQQLTELVGIKTNPEVDAAKSKLAALGSAKSLDQRRDILMGFLHHLEQKGFRAINRGSFGAVFTHPALDYAIKVFRDDPAYLAFVQFAMKSAGNASLPVFRGKPIRIDADNWCVRMEMLDMVADDETYNACEILAQFAAGTDSVEDFVADHVETVSVKDRAAEARLLAQGGLLPTTLAVRKAGRRAGFQMDLHTDNMMVRGQTIVIVDPWMPKGSVA